MNALANRHAQAAERPDDTRKVFLTLGIVALSENPLAFDLIGAVLAGMPGVETIELDAEHQRVWIFGDRTVDTQDLLGTLGWWGYGARVISRQLSSPE